MLTLLLIFVIAEIFSCLFVCVLSTFQMSTGLSIPGKKTVIFAVVLYKA